MQRIANANGSEMWCKKQQNSDALLTILRVCWGRDVCDNQRETDIKDHQKTVICVCSGSIDQIKTQYKVPPFRDHTFLLKNRRDVMLDRLFSTGSGRGLYSSSHWRRNRCTMSSSGGEESSRNKKHSKQRTRTRSVIFWVQVSS